MPKIKVLVLLHFSCLFLLSCDTNRKKKIDSPQDAPIPTDTISMWKLKKLRIVGDFDGDKRMDTVFQHNYSELTFSEIDFAAHPLQNDYDVFMRWFYEQSPDVRLSLNRGEQDSLHLGPGQGLHCLINLGDINLDGSDEIALVVDYLDQSLVNSCRIYSCTNGAWKLLKLFKIHESAFQRVEGNRTTFNEIPGFLEQRNGRWYYSDYQENLMNEETETPDLKPLIIDKSR